MSLELNGADCTGAKPNKSCVAPLGQQLQLDVVAEVRPEGGVGAFQSEVFLGGFQYSRRTCASEVVMQPLDLCLGPTAGAGFGQLAHGGITGLRPPYPASTSSQLVSMSVECPESGTYVVVLSAATNETDDIDLGSKYHNVNGDNVYPRSFGTELVDNDGITIGERVPIADRLTVDCLPEDPQ
jgi:hypothetical protein